MSKLIYLPVAACLFVFMLSFEGVVATQSSTQANAIAMSTCHAADGAASAQQACQ